MSEIKVNSIKGVGASAAAITVNNTDGTCTANITNNLSNRNLIINGAMLVAQRGTSGTNSGYGSVDRFRVQYSGTDEAPTQAQVDVASGTTPYTLGFRKALRITNGNQTSGAGTSDSTHFQYYLEAKDIANSGWNYTSSSSFITLQFWIKSSVAQNFQGRVRTRQGTSYNYAFETGSLSADTWTKVTKTISGNSNLQFNNDTAKNFQIDIFAFLGTDDTSSAVSLDTWAAYASGTQVKDVTSTWYTTDNATLEITGVQLEVGSVATDFEHRLFADELIRCKRYYRVLQDASGGACYMGAVGYNYDVNSVVIQVSFEQEMRATPTLDNTSGTNYYRYYRNSSYVDINAFNAINGMTKYGGAFNNSDSGSGTAGQAGAVVLNNTSAKLAFDAEL